MRALFNSLAMAIAFWIPATVAVLMIASAIPVKSFQLAIGGTVMLLVALLLRLIIRQLAKDGDARQAQL